jgi:hypothetical protein
MSAAGVPQWPVDRAFEEMTASFERFCLAAGLEALGAMMEADAAALCGPRHGRGGGVPLPCGARPAPSAIRPNDADRAYRHGHEPFRYAFGPKATPEGRYNLHPPAPVVPATGGRDRTPACDRAILPPGQGACGRCLVRG